jgi:Heterokaryon incompatibility protein (HET)
MVTEGREQSMRVAVWLAGIRSGDVVRLVPNAFFQGWTNIVRYARIEIGAEFVVPLLPVERPLLFEAVGRKDRAFYRTLQNLEKEIRLVVIEPAGRSEDARTVLRLSLRYTSLADPDHVPYNALSYCWGEDSDAGRIILTDCESGKQDIEIYVRRNLVSALKRLRSVDRPRTLWVDLICINQADLQERAQQVGLMGEIFASAQSVRVWLGEVDDEARKDFTIIRSIAQQCDDTICNSTNPEVNHESPMDQQPHKGAHTGSKPGFPEPRVTHQVIARDTFYHVDTDYIFLRPWFQRM